MKKILIFLSLISLMACSKDTVKNSSLCERALDAAINCPAANTTSFTREQFSERMLGKWALRATQCGFCPREVSDCHEIGAGQADILEFMANGVARLITPVSTVFTANYEVVESNNQWFIQGIGEDVRIPRLSLYCNEFAMEDNRAWDGLLTVYTKTE